MKRREALALWVALARAHESVVASVREHTGSHGLTAAEFGVLEALHHLGPMRLCNLQVKILVSSGGVTFVVDQLERRGLVDRKPDPTDRRARLVSLTRKGAALIAGIFPEHAELIATATSGLEGADRKQAIRLLRRLTKERES